MRRSELELLLIFAVLLWLCVEFAICVLCYFVFWFDFGGGIERL